MIYRIIDITEVSEAKLKETFDNMEKNRKERCLRYKSDEDKRRMLAGEYLAKSLAEEFLSVRKEEITLVNLGSGQPVILMKDKKLCASISHSGNFAAAAVSDTAVGIDIEEMRDVPEGVVRRAFVDEEADYVNSAETEEEKKQRFLQIWTAKEAYLKLKGTGLRDIEKVQVLSFVLGKELDNLQFKAWDFGGCVCTLFALEK